MAPAFASPELQASDCGTDTPYFFDIRFRLNK
jgi:hypothetical protein